ncbi:MAG: twin-arginine translocase TatA/TatE family subunit [Actinobacteria bacterium]|nr:twin-arginine translocase TatA/TatE family subunit [Actinomycetota bacterium]
MFGLGWQELSIILVIALVIFGPSKLPELGRSLGQAISSFKEGTNRAQNAAKQELEDIKKTINDENSEK